jgi:hypothetical protein
MFEKLDFSARLTGDGEFVTIRIPVRELPRTMRAQPARMQIRVIPQARLATSTNVSTPTYVLALDADLFQAESAAGNNDSSKH